MNECVKIDIRYRAERVNENPYRLQQVFENGGDTVALQEVEDSRNELYYLLNSCAVCVGSKEVCYIVEQLINKSVKTCHSVHSLELSRCGKSGNTEHFHYGNKTVGVAVVTLDNKSVVEQCKVLICKKNVYKRKRGSKQIYEHIGEQAASVFGAVVNERVAVEGPLVLNIFVCGNIIGKRIEKRSSFVIYPVALIYLNGK